MSHAVKVETEIKDKALAKAVAKRLGYTCTEKADGTLSLDIRSRWGVPFVIHPDGTSSFDKSYDCTTAGNAIQKFMGEYTTDFFVAQMNLNGMPAMRGPMTVDAHGNAVHTVEVMQ